MLLRLQFQWHKESLYNTYIVMRALWFSTLHVPHTKLCTTPNSQCARSPVLKFIVRSECSVFVLSVPWEYALCMSMQCINKSNGKYLDEGKACLTMHLRFWGSQKYESIVYMPDYCDFTFMHYYIHVLTILHSCIIIKYT